MVHTSFLFPSRALHPRQGLVNVKSNAPVIALEGVGKQFGGTFVIRDVNLGLRPGEILALVGENGAGKSTIVRTLSGEHQPDEGRVLLDGVPVVFAGPQQSAAAGIQVVHQEPTLFPDLSVAENIFIGRQPRRGVLGTDWGRMYRETTEIMNGLLHYTLDPHVKVATLSIAERQIVEIIKALSTNARVLILDEPTAALSSAEVEDLFQVVHRLRSRGVAILFIGHRLDEIQEHADRLAVLRDGRLVASAAPRELTRTQLIQHMVGRDLGDLFPKLDANPGETVLEVEGLDRGTALRNVSFSVRSGEIVGLAGLVGAGRTEVARAIFGIDPVDSGTVRIGGVIFSRRSPRRAIRRGLALVPEDRQGQALVLDWPVTHNLSLAVLAALSRLGLITSRKEKALGIDLIERNAIKVAHPEVATSTLSGGNQQKLVFGKWLATAPRLLLLDEPTRGVDIQTKTEIHRQISELAAEGLAVLLISSELPEILGMSDRILVMREGAITAEFSRADATQEAVMTAATAPNQSRIQGRSNGNPHD